MALIFTLIDGPVFSHVLRRRVNSAHSAGVDSEGALAALPPPPPKDVQESDSPYLEDRRVNVLGDKTWKKYEYEKNGAVCKYV